MSIRSPRRSRTPALRLEVPELDAAIAAAERSAIVVWRGERTPFEMVPARIARTDGRLERDGLYAGWIDALEALNPLYRERHAAWRERAGAGGTDDLAAAVAVGIDIEALALDLERLAILSETVYYSALRRYLALIEIEQGDATIADLWHVERGASWSQWFGERDVNLAAAEAGRDASGTVHGEGWRSGESGLAGSEASSYRAGRRHRRAVRLARRRPKLAATRAPHGAGRDRSVRRLRRLRAPPTAAPCVERGAVRDAPVPDR